MPYQYEDKCNAEGEPTKVLGGTFEPGKPEDKAAGLWRKKLGSRADELRYLKSAERYWYGDSFGSEKRRNPA